MTEKQMKKPEYYILTSKQNMIIKTIIKLNKKTFGTKNNEKRCNLIEKINIYSNEMKKINSIANYLDNYQEKYNSSPEEIIELCQKLLENEKVYKSTIKIDKRRKKEYEF